MSSLFYLKIWDQENLKWGECIIQEERDWFP